MTTRRELIIDKYSELIILLKPLIAGSLFPPLGEIDIIDLLFFFNLYFKNDTNYKTALSDLLQMKNIDVNESKLNEIYEIVLPFIIWLKSLQ